MLTASVVLAALALTLAWPVPLALSRARWTARAPGTALVLWQSIALAGGLSMIGSLVTYGLIPFGDNLIDGGIRLINHLFAGTLPTGATLPQMFALCLAVLLTGHLLLNLVLTAVRSERQRKRHLSLVNLLSAPLEGNPGTRVIDHPSPVAYCLAGTSSSVTVLSEGLLALLDHDQLRAVIAHERAHLAQQHHLVLIAFKSWHSALPWFPIANRAENAVALLVEMLADDQARRATDDRTLATAIALVGSGARSDPLAPELAWANRGEIEPGLVGPRVARLVNPQPPLPLGARVCVLIGAIALLVIPTVLLALI
ncbi:M56 family metallopeptidase [Mycetocola zhujimingii]|uniref:M56 family metallopeptidase n=1 Tax=Mycetocola zhujimingii TaxID=2079792 RepID=UPI000D377733|nr:M56 family metallopeptidase [Mycetocola zhujimingii]AWB86627.1 peptidase M48 [Mycetocola zhujimingii]